MFAAGIVGIGRRLAWRFFGGLGEGNRYVRDLLLLGTLVDILKSLVAVLWKALILDLLLTSG